MPLLNLAFPTIRRAVLGAAALAALGHASAASAADCVPAPQELVQSGVLTIGVSAGVPPMAYMDGNTPTGFDVDMGAELARTLCLKPAFVNMAFTGLLPGINARKFDLLSASVGITPARKEAFDFVPNFVGGVRLVALKQSKLAFKSEYGTCGYKVSTRAGSVEAHALEIVGKQCPAGKPMSMSVFPTDNEAMQQLYKGVVDASFLDWPLAAYVMANDGRVGEASPILSGDGPGTPRHIDGLVVRKGNAGMRAALERALKRMMDDGSYGRLLAKYKLSEGDIRKAD